MSWTCMVHLSKVHSQEGGESWSNTYADEIKVGYISQRTQWLNSLGNSCLYIIMTIWDKNDCKILYFLHAIYNTFHNLETFNYISAHVSVFSNIYWDFTLNKYRRIRKGNRINIKVFKVIANLVPTSWNMRPLTVHRTGGI